MNQMIRTQLTSNISRDAEDDWHKVIRQADENINLIDQLFFTKHNKAVDSAKLNVKVIPAAVLVPIIQRNETPTVLFTKRSENLTNHRGQISFPGGKIEKGDANPAVTALRETNEEIGLPPKNVEVIGRLEDYFVGTGYRITPVVGFINEGQKFLLNRGEVDEIFEVPLSFIMNKSLYRQEQMKINGIDRMFYVLCYERYRIWGATAAILRDLRDTIGS